MNTIDQTRDEAATDLAATMQMSAADLLLLIGKREALAIADCGSPHCESHCKGHSW